MTRLPQANGKEILSALLREGFTLTHVRGSHHKFGLSWQVVPTIVPELLKDHESEKSQRAMTAMMQMKKPDIEAMKRAYAGG